MFKPWFPPYPFAKWRGPKNSVVKMSGGLDEPIEMRLVVSPVLTLTTVEALHLAAALKAAVEHVITHQGASDD